MREPCNYINKMAGVGKEKGDNMDGFEEISFRISYIDRFWGNPFGKNIS